MGAKTEKLDILFNEWEEKHYAPKPDGTSIFKRDGIINEELYDNAKTKILFITKEPNNPEQKEGDFRVDWNDKLNYTFAYRIAEWSYGILHNFPKYEDAVSNRDDAIRCIAFMNIKKSGGKSLSISSEIFDHFIMSKDLIYKQIELIKPDLIILGISFETKLRSGLFPGVEWKDSGYGIKLGSHEGKYQIIDFYHPSSRTPPAASYCLLEKVVSQNLPI